MSYDIKDFLKKFFSSRLFVLSAIFIVFFAVIIMRVFVLQIMKGKSYQDNFSLKIQQTQAVNAARGNIYDRNGKLLAYNELAYSISIIDNSKYATDEEKNETLNGELAEILMVLDQYGQSPVNDFKIDLNDDGTYSFNVTGSALQRFRVDVFGKSSADKLEYNKDYDFDEANATAEQVMAYLMSKKIFGVSKSYDQKIAYEIVVLRYAIKGNFYARYKSTKIAQDVSDEVVAYVNEHMDSLPGVSV